MREFYFNNQNTNEVFRALVATTDIDCPPLDFFRLESAYYFANLFQDSLKINCPIEIPDDFVRHFVLQETDKMITQNLSKSVPHPVIHKILTDNTLSHREQVRLLKGVKLTPLDILWLNKEAQDMGYLLNIYHEEKYPEKFNEKIRPLLFYQENDTNIEKIGSTNMTDGELRALLKERKVIQARIYHKGNTWHCFYFTFKGLAGEESGLMGSKPHYHYLSDKSGIVWDVLLQKIKDCNMPSSKVHIVIDR